MQVCAAIGYGLEDDAHQLITEPSTSDAMGYDLCANDVIEMDILAYTFPKDHRGLYTPMQLKSLGWVPTMY